MWACEPGLSQQICLASEEEIRRWKHWWKSVLPDHLSLLTTWYKTDFHFSRRGCTFPSQVAEHHQRWLEMDCIYGAISSQPFCLALLVSFLTTHLERCQTSYWWLMCGKSFFMLLLMETWRSVAILLIMIPFSSKSWRQREKPSFSMAFDELTSDTWTTLDATTSLLKCRCHIWHSDQGCHTCHHHRDLQLTLKSVCRPAVDSLLPMPHSP